MSNLFLPQLRVIKFSHVISNNREVHKRLNDENFASHTGPLGVNYILLKLG